MDVIGRKHDFKPKTANSGRIWPVSGKTVFEAFRGRNRGNLKHESFSEGFFLEDNVDSFVK